MAPDDSGSLPPAVRFPDWQREYLNVLLETDTFALWKCIEIAEAKILLRCDVVATAPDLQDERQALAEALSNLDKIKRERLRFR